jgi:hypothetical protein
MASRGLLSGVASWRDSLRLRVWRSVGRLLRLWVFVRRCNNTGRGASCGGSWGYGSGWLLHPVSISARIGSAWSDRVTVSGILGGVLGLLVLLPRLLGVWRGLLLTF